MADGYWNVMAKRGKPLNPYRLGFAQFVAVSETDQQAELDYASHMDYLIIAAFTCIRALPTHRVTVRNVRCVLRCSLRPAVSGLTRLTETHPST